MHAPVIAQKAMVSTQNNYATLVGLDILREGGNAVDAAVAVGFALAVTLPRAGNLGGGGFMLVHSAATGKTTSFDYRETAPTGITAEHFLKPDGSRDREVRFSWDAVGVPGTVAGLHAAWAKHGSLPWHKLLQPAIRLAQRGFVVSHDLAEILTVKRNWLSRNDATRRAFYRRDGQPYAVGEIMRRPALARTLKLIARKGPDTFYRGRIADLIVADMQRFGGHIDHDDLANYKVIEREPLFGQYRGYTVAAMAPPSSGGIAIIEMLNILENFPVGRWGYSAQSLHILAESMKLAFADRGSHVADPAFYKVPVAQLLDKTYAQKLAQRIRLDKPLVLPHKPEQAAESPSTTHFSIVDAWGNAVSNTYTLSASFGAGITIADTGILLNNQISTFSVQADVPGATGFMASKANRLEAGKRPVSSQSPTIVLRDGKPFLVLGSPGGSRIINVVVQLIVNVIDHRMNIAEATHQYRIHHQWVPDVLQVEPGFNPDTQQLLETMGHTVETTATMGSSQSILATPEYLFGASDPRRPNALTLGLD